MKNKRTLLILLTLIILGSSIPTVLKKYLQTPRYTIQEGNQIKASGTTEIVQQKAGWQTYTNTTLGFRMNYPQDVFFEQNGDFSILFRHNDTATNPTSPTFIYVSVIPENQKNSEGIIYNYNPTDYKILLATPIGENAVLSTNPDMAEWFTYNRQPDTSFNGQNAKVFINLNPWEFPSETIETRYIIEQNKRLFILGYYQNTIPSTELTPATIADMIQSFMIL